MRWKRLKSGRLYRFPLDCPDLETFILRRIARRLGIIYIPFTLRFYEELYLREDLTPQNRALVEYCKKRGIRTYVVQEGAYEYGGIGQPYHEGHGIIQADYFLVTEPMYQKWINSGFPRRRLIIYHPQKRTEDYKGILFLNYMTTWEEQLYKGFWDGTNTKIFKVLEKYIDEDVVFKLHPNGQGLLRPYLPPHRIVNASAEYLIERYDKIYCFSNSSIRMDAEDMGKKPILVDDE